MNAVFQILAALALIGVCGFLIVVVARAGDEKGARDVARRRRVTPYRSVPTSVDDGGYDEHGRPY